LEALCAVGAGEPVAVEALCVVEVVVDIVVQTALV